LRGALSDSRHPSPVISIDRNIALIGQDLGLT